MASSVQVVVEIQTLTAAGTFAKSTALSIVFTINSHCLTSINKLVTQYGSLLNNK